MAKPIHKQGDWLRWWRADVLVIGEVQYVREQPRYPYDVEYVTDRGIVTETEVLEARDQP